MKLRHIISSLFLSFCMFFSATVFSESTPISDSVITTKIKSKIALDKSLSVFKVDVSTTKGIVTLKGKVDSDSDASNAVEIAQSTEGVVDVNAEGLAIKESKHPFSDTEITAKIKGTYLKEKLFGDKDIAAMTISVETTDGVVTLSGNADNKAQAENAIKLAKAVKGVKKVDSRIIVK